ncbi:MAG: hypothetical protein RL592_85 [Verrucomicrobiota bacterium]
MAAFFRGLILFLFGAIVGAGGILFFTPSFNVVVSRNPGAAKPIEVAAAPAPAVVPAAPATPAAPVAKPAPVVAKPAEVASAPAPAPVAAEPAIDFKSISEHLILWPTTVTVKTATTVPVLVDGKKTQDLALDVGTVLQVSKVLADGSLEARAKGAKFEIKSTLTDFSVELGKRVSELVAKGAKIDSPFASAPTATPATPAAPAPAVPVPAATVAAAAPKGPLTLAQRVDILFGNKPDAAVPAATVAPVTAAPATTPAPAVAPAATAPVVEAAPTAPAADPKGAEKGKDLDRKINQLFK